jgi:hypothetical protein
VAANSLEGGIAEIDLREQHGKWKISRSCVCYLEERRLYHRRDGEVVKQREDVLSAARYGLMMRRHFRPFDECDTWHTGAAWPLGPGNARRSSPNQSSGDFDLFTGKSVD